MTDARITPANGRVAHLSLRGKVEAERYVPGEPARVAVPVADLLDAPGGRRQRQALRGDRVLVLDRTGGLAFVQAAKDGYCGYLAEAALGPDRQSTHWVAAPATHLYPAPDIKAPETAALSLGARLTIVEVLGRFARTDMDEFVPAGHLRKVGDWAADPVDVAFAFLGTPYLWGGNTRAGLDCSGLVQAAHLACGIACPGDSDLQEQGIGSPVPPPMPPDGPLMRGDLLFWKGHVALAVDEVSIIHANAHAMAVTVEPVSAAISRTEANGGGGVRSVRRL